MNRIDFLGRRDFVRIGGLAAFGLAAVDPTGRLANGASPTQQPPREILHF